MSLLQGTSLIAGSRGQATGITFQAINPATGEALEPTFHEASDAEVAHACAEASKAFVAYSSTTPAERATFLRTIADEIESLGDALLDRYTTESALPRGRADGERARTCLQLRQFADALETGQWDEPRHEVADAGRSPLPKPDLRQRLRPIGPVVVFGPSNFPLAYAVAGGDSASALAAGCPVVVKAHPSHPGVSELVGIAIARAVASCKMPAGVFSLLYGDGRRVGSAIVSHPGIKGAGFTGSKVAGKQLWQLCQQRPVPIPFFGELSSLNPVCLLPGAITTSPVALADALAASATLGCGQFCTNPGLILHLSDNDGTDTFVNRLLEQMKAVPATPMLNVAIRASYGNGLKAIAAIPGVEALLTAEQASGPGGAHATPALHRCTAEVFVRHPLLHEEVFGPCTLLVGCRDLDEMQRTVALLEGQLTCSIHGTDAELSSATELLNTLESRCGRLIFNGWPTGVEVSPAMVHGGPWPATTDNRFTSVGVPAIRRWLRPVCWQNTPTILDHLRPPLP